MTRTIKATKTILSGSHANQIIDLEGIRVLTGRSPRRPPLEVAPCVDGERPRRRPVVRLIHRITTDSATICRIELIPRNIWTAWIVKDAQWAREG